jgi:hypothetical protein
LSAQLYFSLHKGQQACEVVAKAIQNFPQDDGIRSLMDRCTATPAGNN